MSIIQIVALAFLAYVLLVFGLCLLIKNRHAVIEKIKDIFSSREGRLTVLKVLGILILVAALIAGFIFVTKPEVKASLSISIRGLGDKTLSYNLERVTETDLPWRYETQIKGIDKTGYRLIFAGGDENTSIEVHMHYDVWEENGKEKIGSGAPAIYINGEQYLINTRRTIFLNGDLTNKNISYSLRKDKIEIDYYSLPYGRKEETEIYVGAYFEIYVTNTIDWMEWLYHPYFF